MRLFVGIPLPEALHAGIQRLQEQLAASGAELSIVPPGNLHFTVKFLGEVAAEHIEEIALQLAKVAERHARFSVSLRGAGAFPSPDFARVVWVGVEDNAAFVSLVRDVREQLAAFRSEDHVALQIHLTVARVRPPKSKEQLAYVIRQFSAEGFGSFVAERMVLYESVLQKSGAAYRAVRTFPLKAAVPDDAASYSSSVSGSKSESL